MVLELLTVGYMAGIATLLGMIVNVIRYFMTTSRGSLQMVVEQSSEGMLIQLHNRIGRPVRIYRIILSRTVTVYKTIQTEIDRRLLNDGGDQTFIIPQHDLTTFLIRVDDELKLTKHKMLKGLSTKIPVRLYFETSEGGMYSQWLLFRKTEDNFEFHDHVRHRGSFYTVSRRLEYGTSVFIATILCSTEFISVLILMSQYPEESGYIYAIGLVVLVLTLFLSSCIVASYGTKSRILTIISCMVVMIPMLGFNTIIDELSVSIFFWMYTSSILSMMVLSIAGWGLQSNRGYDDMYVNADHNINRKIFLPWLIILIKRILS